jgi:hypothetical protein
VTEIAVDTPITTEAQSFAERRTSPVERLWDPR